MSGVVSSRTICKKNSWPFRVGPGSSSLFGLSLAFALRPVLWFVHTMAGEGKGEGKGEAVPSSSPRGSVVGFLALAEDF